MDASLISRINKIERERSRPVWVCGWLVPVWPDCAESERSFEAGLLRLALASGRLTDKSSQRAWQRTPGWGYWRTTFKGLPSRHQNQPKRERGLRQRGLRSRRVKL